MAWAVSMTAEIVLFLLLYRYFGIFPGMEWILIAGGVLSIVLTWRALKGIWVWLLWVSGLVWTDVPDAG